MAQRTLEEEPRKKKKSLQRRMKDQKDRKKTRRLWCPKAREECFKLGMGNSIKCYRKDK